MRRNRKQARSNQNEGLKPDFEGPRSSISSHSSGDEGEDLVHTRSTLPTTLLELSQAQSTSMDFNDNPEGEVDPKRGNTCNALSGKTKPSQEIGQNIYTKPVPMVVICRFEVEFVFPNQSHTPLHFSL